MSGELLSVELALQRVLESVRALGSEEIGTLQALGRVVAVAPQSLRRLPGFDNSAMDGYALRAADLLPTTTPLTIVGESAAGGVAPQALGTGQAMRILTGAPIPPGADTVVMQEDTERQGTTVTIQKAPRAGANIRRAGEDLEPGRLLQSPGVKLGPGDIGALAAAGVRTVHVVKKPRVTILSTGSELADWSKATLGPGEVPNSNTPMLCAAVSLGGGIPMPTQIQRDDEAAIVQALERGAQDSDFIVTSGGVSVGDYDYVRKILESQGQLGFWRLDMKPGKPVAYGSFQGTPLLGLPGNPVSCLVGYVLLGAPALAKLCGHAEPGWVVATARLSAPLRPDKKRREFVRGRLLYRDGEAFVQPNAARGSHQVSSLVGANVLIDTPPGSDPIPEGDAVRTLAVAG